MKWQQFLPLIMVLGVAVALVWRSSGKKTGSGCQCGCNHEPEPKSKKPDAVR